METPLEIENELSKFRTFYNPKQPMNYPIRYYLILSFLFIFLADNSLSAQKTDWGSWIDLSAIKKLRATTLSLNGEFYTKQNIREIDRISIGLEGNHAITSFAGVGVGYLLMNSHKNENYELRNRFYTHLILKWQLANFSFSHQERFQLTQFPHSKAKSEYYWRNHLKIEFNPSDWCIKPFMIVESFFRLGKPISTGFDEGRYSLGISRQITKIQRIKLYGLLSSSSSENNYITGLTYDFSF